MHGISDIVLFFTDIPAPNTMDHNTNLEYLYSISSDELHRQHRPAQITQYVPANSDEEMRNLGGSSLFAARLLKARFSSSSLFPLPV